MKTPSSCAVRLYLSAQRAGFYWLIFHCIIEFCCIELKKTFPALMNNQKKQSSPVDAAVLETLLNNLFEPSPDLNSCPVPQKDNRLLFRAGPLYPHVKGKKKLIFSPYDACLSSENIKTCTGLSYLCV